MNARGPSFNEQHPLIRNTKQTIQHPARLSRKDREMANSSDIEIVFCSNTEETQMLETDMVPSVPDTAGLSSPKRLQDAGGK